MPLFVQVLALLSLVYQVLVIPVINRAVYLGKQRVEKVLIPL